MTKLKPVYFLAAAAGFGVLAGFALRSNYQHMSQLRDAVYAADKAGQDVAPPLNDLRHYVYAHMNTNLATTDGVYPPIQLKYTYERLVQQRSQQTADGNSQVYSDAQAYCEQQNSTAVYGYYRVPCITEYVNSHGLQATPAAISDSLYKFDFVSPSWSPDLAGWSIVLAILSALAAIGLFIAQRFIIPKVKTR